ncbi:ABC transporter ATP-binding protein [Stomatohabitans albus]|uniref:ABC transporter ATP-binding protein n=1 Tax=Stomatohabitans albus TaxID=3110766 RepID=UPI00300CA7C4
MNDPSVRIEHAQFSYQGGHEASGGFDSTTSSVEQSHTVTALRDISLRCEPGTITLICGASGSGKSTVLRLINGLVPHVNEGTLTGTVQVMGESVPDAPIEALGTHSETVFQNPRTQFFTSEVLSELAFRGENWGKAPETILNQAMIAAKQVGIEDLLDQELMNLSGGQLQKVACAQALTPQPPVLIFDEPTSNLSPEAIDQMGELLHTLKAAGHTIIVAEHRLYFLRDLADHVVVMADGAIAHEYDGPTFFNLSEDDRQALGLRTLVDPRTPLGPSVHDGTDKREHDDGLVLDQVRFSYGDKRILDIDHAAFRSHTITAITGDNGVGKSTLARVLCGLARPARGGVIKLKHKRVRSRQRLSETTVVMQDVHRQLFGESVLTEVMIGQTGEDATTRARDVLRALGLAGTEERHPLALSGGQKQRLVVAAAVVADKSVYIFDEPTSGVDYRHLNGISAQMRELADRGAVVLVITHDPELIATCADQIVRMESLDTIGTGQPQLSFHLP